MTNDEILDRALELQMRDSRLSDDAAVELAKSGVRAPNALATVRGHEGTKQYPYRPKFAGSGPTIGAGFDLGQHSPDEIRTILADSGLEPELIDELSTAGTLKDAAADQWIAEHPNLWLSKAKEQALSAARVSESERRAIAQIGEDAWERLTPDAQEEVVATTHLVNTLPAPFIERIKAGDPGAFDSLGQQDRYGPRFSKAKRRLAGTGIAEDTEKISKYFVLAGGGRLPSENRLLGSVSGALEAVGGLPEALTGDFDPALGGLSQMAADTLLRVSPEAIAEGRWGDVLDVSKKDPEFLAREMRGEVPLSESIDALGGIDILTGPAFGAASALGRGALAGGARALGGSMLRAGARDLAEEAGVGILADAAGRSIAEATDSPGLALGGALASGILAPGIARRAYGSVTGRPARLKAKAEREGLEGVGDELKARYDTQEAEDIAAEGLRDDYASEAIGAAYARPIEEKLTPLQRKTEANRRARIEALDIAGTAVDPETRRVLDKFPTLADEARAAAEFNDPNVKARTHNDLGYERLGRKLSPAEHAYLKVRARYDNIERAIIDPDNASDLSENTTAIYRDAMSKVKKAAQSLTDDARRAIDMVNPNEIHMKDGVDAKRRVVAKALGRTPTPAETDYALSRAKAWKRVLASTGEDIHARQMAGDRVRQTTGRDADEPTGPAEPGWAAATGGRTVRGQEGQPPPPGATQVYAAREHADWDQNTNLVMLTRHDGHIVERTNARLVEHDELRNAVYHVTRGAKDGFIRATRSLGPDDADYVSVTPDRKEAQKIADDLNNAMRLVRGYAAPDETYKTEMKAVLDQIVAHDKKTGAMPRAGNVNTVALLTDVQWDWRQAMLEYMERRAGQNGARPTRMPLIEDIKDEGDFFPVKIEKGDIPTEAAIVHTTELSPNELQIFADIKMPNTRAAARPDHLATAGDTTNVRTGLRDVPKADVDDEARSFVGAEFKGKPVDDPVPDRHPMFPGAGSFFDDDTPFLRHEGFVTRPQRATGKHGGGIKPKPEPQVKTAPKTEGWQHPSSPERRAASEPPPKQPKGGYDPERMRLDPKSVRSKRNIPTKVKEAVSTLYNTLTTTATLRGPAWDQARQIIRSGFAEKRQINALAKAQLERIMPKAVKQFRDTRRAINTIHQLFAEADDEEVFDFIRRIEAKLPQIDGKVISAESKEAVVSAMHSILEPLRQQFTKLSPDQKRGWYDNYFPRIWDPEATVANQARILEKFGPDAIPEAWLLKSGTDPEVQRVYQGVRSSKGFATARQSIEENPFDSFSEMERMGFVPQTRNPVEMILFKANQMSAHLTAVRQLDDLMSRGVVRRMLRKDYEAELAAAQREGLYYDWHPVGDVLEGVPLMPERVKDLEPGGKQVGVKHLRDTDKYAYVAPSNVKQLLTNISSAGLMQGARTGSFYRLWRKMNGWLNGIQLGISTFHTSTMTNENMVSNIAQGLQRATAGVLSATGVKKYIDPVTGKKVSAGELASQSARYLGKAGKSPAIFARSLPGLRKLTEGRFTSPGELAHAEMTKLIQRGLEATLRGEVNPERMRNVPVLKNLHVDEQSLIGMIRKGADALAAESAGAFDPTIPMMMELAVRSGGDFLHTSMPTDWHRTFHDIWSNARAEMNRGQKATQYGGNAMGEAVTKLTQSLSKPLFDTVIPQAKTQAFIDMMQWELMRMGGDYDADSVLKKAMEVKDSVDNRFGEMCYDNLMMHRVARDVMMLTQRAPGWNLGTIREIGGGFLDTARYAAGKVRQGGELALGKEMSKNAPQWTQRMSYNVGLAMHTALLASAYQYIMTGTLPSDDIKEGEDFMETMKRFIFPKNGQKKNGYDQRSSMAGYEKDFYAVLTHPITTATHKVAPAIPVVQRLVTGNDYYGNLLYDPAANAVTQWAQRLGGTIAEAATPFSASSIREQVKTGGGGASAVAQNVLGFNPAPARVVRSEADNKMTEYIAEFKPSPQQAPLDWKRGEARREIVTFLRSKQDPNEPDREKPTEALKTYVTLGGERGAADLRRLVSNVQKRDDFQNRLNGFLAEIKTPSRAYALFDVVEQMSPDELRRGWDSIMKRVYTLRERARSKEEFDSINEQWQGVLEKRREAKESMSGG